MRLRIGGRQGSGASPPAEELFDLARRYVIQETIGPLRRIGKVLALGLSGATLFGFGGALCLLGLLRALQTETGTTFRGNWSFAPYALTAVAGGAVLGGSAAVAVRIRHSSWSKS